MLLCTLQNWLEMLSTTLLCASNTAVAAINIIVFLSAGNNTNKARPLLRMQAVKF